MQRFCCRPRGALLLRAGNLARTTPLKLNVPLHSGTAKGAAMNIVTDNIKWILLVSGALTCTMVYAAVDPQSALNANFGETLQGPVADVVVRNWGVLITLMGGMLIYAAFNPSVRVFAITVAGISKLFFAMAVFGHGGRFLGHQAAIAATIDLLWVVLFLWYLLASRSHRRTAKLN